MFVFEPEVSWYFPAGRSDNLSGNFRLPVFISTPVAPMRCKYPYGADPS